MQSSTQEIGEELEDGVIYSISLRKVQLHHTANKGQRWLGVSWGLLLPQGRFQMFPCHGNHVFIWEQGVGAPVVLCHMGRGTGDTIRSPILKNRATLICIWILAALRPFLGLPKCSGLLSWVAGVCCLRRLSFSYPVRRAPGTAGVPAQT